MEKPLLICMTPIKNEAWCLDVFLTCASLWADHIIIADQGSTDGSREIALRYPKVILIDNNDTELHETNRQRLLFAEARKIPGSKVFIALDADEVFSANFKDTEDWIKIVNAKSGDIFNFLWAQIESDCKHYGAATGWSQWAFYDDGTNPPEEGYIHVARVPWPKNSTPNECYSRIKEPNKSIISLFRSYHPKNREEILPIPNRFTANYQKLGIDIFKDLNLQSVVHWQDKQIVEYYETYGQQYFQYIYVDKKLIDKINLNFNTNYIDCRSLSAKLLHFYLNSTRSISDTFPIRVMDKILKHII